MKHLVIGTAGHVDHGKTCLTKALTGTDTDRLKEEQKRGITIEIGFAQLTLPNGQQASIVDVPGHEKFVRNMLVGATGIDVVLLVVAADEGFMPQTQEHLDILSLLDVKNGIIVLTKADMVDEDWLEVVKDDTRERVKGTFLEDAPMLTVSAYTGQGIEELKNEIVSLVERTESRKSDRPFRLPVDRAFSIKGFGTVITGTLVDGTIQTGDSVMVYPQQKLARVRELQNHDESQNEVEAGMRVAVNLTGVERQELVRGCTIAEPDSMELSKQIAVHLQMTPDAPFNIKNSSKLHFHLGTQEMVCKVRLLDADQLEPGQSGYAVLAFPEELVARNLDRFIVRFFSPMTTVGGGMVLDMDSPRLKRKDEAVLERLKRLNDSPDFRIQQMVIDAGYALTNEKALLKRSGLSATVVREVLQRHLEEGTIIQIENGLIAKETMDAIWSRAEELLGKFHKENSLQDGLPLGELREKLFASSSKTLDSILNYFVKTKKLRLVGSCAALSTFKCAFSPEQRSMQEKLNNLYQEVGFEAPLTTDVAAQFANRQKPFQQVMVKMQKEGTLIPLTPQTCAHKVMCQKALDEFIGMFQDSDQVTLAEFRTKLGVSRKYAQMYLDYFDRLKISKMVGDHRILLKPDYKIG